METKNKILNKLTNLLFFFSILFFTVGLNLQDNPPSGWYQQFLPDVNNMPISDIEFLDSLVGFAVTTGNDTNFILKTTNGGDNWFISYKNFKNFSRVIFINDSIGFVCGSSFQLYGAIYKTTNTGENWFTLNTPFAQDFEDMSVLNEDTIWVVDDNSFDGGVFRTTNGGQNWTQQYDPTNKIYMFNGNTGFISRGASNGIIYKTTNSGLNWTQIPSEHGFLDMYFIDTLIGWKVISVLKKTTDGGLNWIKQQMPSDPHFWTGGEGLMEKFSFVNTDTIWGVSENYRFGPGNYRGIIWKTTNGGGNWGFQIPDTSIHIFRYNYIDFVNKLNGWSYYTQTGVHTVTGGGDSTIYLGINKVSNEIPSGFELYQNYPNPFNPVTKIKFEIPKSSFISLIIYNILGKEIETLVNEKLSLGSYEVDWNASGKPSGVYFYRLMTMPDGRKAEDYSETKRMILIK